MLHATCSATSKPQCQLPQADLVFNWSSAILVLKLVFQAIFRIPKVYIARQEHGLCCKPLELERQSLKPYQLLSPPCDVWNEAVFQASSSQIDLAISFQFNVKMTNQDDKPQVPFGGSQRFGAQTYAAHYSARTVSSHSTFENSSMKKIEVIGLLTLGVQKRASCCPFFCKRFFLAFDFLNLFWRKLR